MILSSHLTVYNGPFTKRYTRSFHRSTLTTIYVISVAATAEVVDTHIVTAPLLLPPRTAPIRYYHQQHQPQQQPISLQLTHRLWTTKRSQNPIYNVRYDTYKMKICHFWMLSFFFRVSPSTVHSLNSYDRVYLCSSIFHLLPVPHMFS
jgi:hypothetical protein